jgi:hypothetical protein
MHDDAYDGQVLEKGLLKAVQVRGRRQLLLCTDDNYTCAC